MSNNLNCRISYFQTDAVQLLNNSVGDAVEHVSSITDQVSVSCNMMLSGSIFASSTCGKSASCSTLLNTAAFRQDTLASSG